ncbi:MAG TPA: class A beta-lactamase-related serine hydrolase [Myxococcales bacterium]|nr:class A beta-lactamase-related serine hydrolase [Myxococcales bacterium]HIK84141.1 class A beta-lactamase-related serine hydrolase [Myxococcales bacterium]
MLTMVGSSLRPCGIAAVRRCTGEASMTIHGVAEAPFWPVVRAFERQLDSTGGGAAVCVYHEGRKVVDLWGGVRDEEERPWREDTMAMSFSTSKGITSTLLHILADRGLLKYDDPVAHYWPEFAQGGKGAISVRDLMTHRAGLSRLRPLLDHGERILDWDYMVKAMERAESKPTAHSAYHALTYGWLTGELIQRITGKNLEKVIREELAEPLGLDGLYIGAPPEAVSRAAQLSGRPGSSRPGLMSKIFSEVTADAVTFFHRMIGSPLDMRHMLDALVPPGDADALWHDRILEKPVPAVNGLFTARSLARLYAAIAEGGTLDGTELLSPEMIPVMGRVHVETRDRVIPIKMGWRLGYHTAFTTRGSLASAFGHFGFGGSGAWADPTKRLSVAMVNNRLGGTPFGDMRIASIGSAVVTAAKRLPKISAGAGRWKSASAYEASAERLRSVVLS